MNDRLHPSVPSSMNEDLGLGPGAAPPLPNGKAPPREREWAEPEGEVPVLDAARMPLSAFMRHKTPQGALFMFVWLRIARPLLLAAFWVGVVFYAWHHFFQVWRPAEGVNLLTLYALSVLGIFALMLLLAPVRRRAIADEETRGRSPDSTVAQLAEYTSLAPQRLTLWQRARRLLVQHDRDGRVTDAADLDTEPAMLTPSGTAVRKRRA